MPRASQVRSIFDLNRPAIVAHRGASAHAPENTLTAFKLAIEQGADAIELDARLSADGQVVVIHDDTVDRTTNGSGRVSSLTMAELQRFQAGNHSAQPYTPETIPSLAEVFDTVGQRIFIIVELKNLSSPLDETPEKVANLVQEFNLEHSVFFISFNLIALLRARRALPKMPLGLLTFAGMADVTLRLNLVRFGPGLAFIPNHQDVTPVLVQAAHHKKSRVYTYTVDQPDKMKDLLDAGVDGVFTNDPLVAQKIWGDLRL